MVFLPCILSVVSSRIIRNGEILLGYWIIAFLLGLYAVQRSGKMTISVRQKNWIVIWLILLVIMLVNNNGDLQNGTYTPIVNFVMMAAFSLLIVMNDRFNEKYVFSAMMLLLFIQLIAGYFFLIFPDKLLALQSVLVSSEQVWIDKFVLQVNSGAFMGLVSHYSTSGMYMALGTVITGGFLLTGRARTGKFSKLMLVVFGVFFVALVLTQKRGHLLFGVVALLAMYLVGYVRGNMKKRLKQILAIIIIAAAAFIVAMQIPAFANTISRFAVGSISSADLNDISSGRVDELWMPAWEEFKSHPLLGIGWRQFKYLHPMSNGVNNDCHNIYIQLLCETGIVGFAVFMIVMISTYVMGWKALIHEKKNVNSTCYDQLMFAFGYQTFFLLYGLTGNPLYDMPCYFPYFISCALIYKYAIKSPARSLAKSISYGSHSFIRNIKKVNRNEA